MYSRGTENVQEKRRRYRRDIDVEKRHSRGSGEVQERYRRCTRGIDRTGTPVVQERNL